MKRLVVLLCMLASVAAAGERTPEATSLLGEPLYPPDLPADVRADREAKLAEALKEYKDDPRDANNIIWLGRRTAYLGRYQDAIAVFSEGIKLHRQDARMYRHRGHRYITTRQFNKAIADLKVGATLIAGKPDQVEPDGLPNAQNIPTSTLHSNIWYHLGLALYLEGRFDEALAAYQKCIEVSRNPDMWCATVYWTCMSLGRVEMWDIAKEAVADLPDEDEVIENHTYYRLLKVFAAGAEADAAASDDDIDNATYQYGIANWKLIQGETDAAQQMFDRILENPQWAAFGYIAAEAEVARRRGQ